MRNAMAGAWGAGLRAATPPEDARESEVITMPAEKIRSFSREATLIPRDREALARELQRELAQSVVMTARSMARGRPQPARR